MTADEVKAARKSQGLTPLEWGRAVGYKGKNKTVQTTIYQWESGAIPVPPDKAFLIGVILKNSSRRQKSTRE